MTVCVCEAEARVLSADCSRQRLACFRSILSYYLFLHMLRCARALPIYARLQILGTACHGFKQCPAQLGLTTSVKYRSLWTLRLRPITPPMNLARSVTSTTTSNTPSSTGETSQTVSKLQKKEPETSTPASAEDTNLTIPYEGPLTVTFRRLKIFSLSSLALSFGMAPFLFVLETTSSLPLTARAALAFTAMGTSGISTALIAWCGKPYVANLRYLSESSEGTASSTPGLEMITLTLGLHPRVTRVYDTAFLVPTNRPFATWELAECFKLSPKEVESWKSQGLLPREETIAETMDKDGRTIGRWIVSWDENGTGTCYEVGKVARSVIVYHRASKPQYSDRPDVTLTENLLDISMCTKSYLINLFANVARYANIFNPIFIALVQLRVW